MFEPNLRIGQVLTETEVNHLFECQTQKGIRRGIKNNVIVLIHKTYENRYPDVWNNDILLYTGSNASSDENGQTLVGPGNNNGFLRDIWINRNRNDNPTIYLLKKPKSNTCIYLGEAKIVAEPYKEPSAPESSFYVWRFPLKLVPIEKDRLIADYLLQEKMALKKNIVELGKNVRETLKLDKNVKGIMARDGISKVYDINPLFSAYVKKRADGICDLCKHPAPFLDADGMPYLEIHHIEGLSSGGKDSPDNMVALCPNCQKRIHVFHSSQDEQELKQCVSQYPSFAY